MHRIDRSGCGDDELAVAARSGDESAFALLLHRHREWVYRVAYAVVGDAESADDATQEVFVRLYRHLADYEPRGRFVPWLKNIAINTARNALRNDRPRRDRVSCRPLHDGFEGVSAGSDPEAVLTSRLLREEVRTALQGLPAEQRQAVLLYYFSGQGVEDIARIARCPPGTIKSRLYHARRHLREALRHIEFA
jgi:RNA polymerase sigma-70 factor (ECF subfamily)